MRPNGLRVRDLRTGHERETRVFEHASIRGRGAHPALDANRSLRVRLQGIDAPELHYMPVADGVQGLSRPFRQPGGEHAALALARCLRTFGTHEIPCVVESRVSVS